jgi:hypothetical protein
LKAIRNRLNYANVAATIALILSLGGATAFAATHLAKSSVGSAQLKRDAVTSAKVKDGSLRSADFMAGQLPAGSKGEQGPKGSKGDPGPQGAPGLSGYIQEDKPSASNSNSPKSVEVSCPSGTTVIGGGAFISPDNVGANNIALRESGPQSGDASQAQRWFAQAFEAVPTNESWVLRARVICAKVAP